MFPQGTVVFFLGLLATHSHLSYAQSTSSSLAVSQDGGCGGSSNQTCLSSSFGDCCSSRGYCGSTNDFCNPSGGCQAQFGSCSTNTSLVSYDGKCGSTDPNHQVCIGSTFGSCCSAKGWCGTGGDYCSAGCQSDYGTCGGTNVTTESNPTPQPSQNSTATPSPSATADSASASTSNAAAVNGQGHSITGLYAAIGVLAGLLVLCIVALVFLWRKSSLRQHENPVEVTKEANHVVCKCGRVLIFEAPSLHDDERKSPTVETVPRYAETTPKKADAAELSNASDRLPELQESAKQTY